MDSDKMNPAIKAVWLDDLRSPRFQQGREELHPESNSFCCLGVLCDQYLRTQGRSWGEPDVGVPEDEDWAPMDHYHLDGEYETLPEAVIQWAGLTNTDPVVYCAPSGREEGAYPLSDLNDKCKLPFSQLADLIEAQL